jgi:alcohol dehydrogenase
MCEKLWTLPLAAMCRRSMLWRNATGRRAVPVRLSSSAAMRFASVHAAAGGGAEIALDKVGQAQDANATLTAVRTRRRGGRLVLMGQHDHAAAAALWRGRAQQLGDHRPVHVSPHAYRSLLGLLRSGLLDISAIRRDAFRSRRCPSMAAETATSLESP